MACQYAKAMGLRIIAIDAGDEKKKMTTEELGAEAFVDFASSQNVVKDVQAATKDGLGPHAVLLVAVTEKPFQQAAEVSQIMQPKWTDADTISVRPTQRYRCRHWSSSRCIPQSTSLPDSDSDEDNQRIICWQSKGYI